MERGQQKTTAANLSNEAQRWRVADELRGSMGAAEYKHVVLGFIFLMHISDAFEEGKPRWWPNNRKVAILTRTAQWARGRPFPAAPGHPIDGEHPLPPGRQVASYGRVRAQTPGAGLRARGGMPAELQSYLRDHHGAAWVYELIAVAVTGQIDMEAAACRA